MMETDILPNLHRMLSLMIENSDNEVIQSILEKSFGSASTEPVMTGDTTNQEPPRSVESRYE